YSDEVRKKIEFIITFIEKLTEDQLTSSEKSILDRCLRKIYQDFKYKNDDPVLSDLYKALKNQTEELAEQIALKMEIYIEGSLDIFAKKSNVNINKRLVCFDIKDLREQLRPSAITVILDSTWERLNHNRDLRKFTRLYIDEFHLLAKNKSSSEWLVEAWKRVRKYRGIPTGITQNIPDIIINKNIASMLSNSEITVIMNQKAKDKDELINVMGLSENQVDKVINCQAGTGLLVAGKTVVGFNNRVSPEEIPNLYKLITTSHKD
ncbi:MAG TPA: conjugal transfer protein TraE, partial [Halanaerobiales bacterium]|nr:conjugal transfer protein TraE [Halanaerobiales bacterium]